MSTIAEHTAVLYCITAPRQRARPDLSSFALQPLYRGLVRICSSTEPPREPSGGVACPMWSSIGALRYVHSCNHRMPYVQRAVTGQTAYGSTCMATHELLWRSLSPACAPQVVALRLHLMGVLHVHVIPQLVACYLRAFRFFEGFGFLRGRRSPMDSTYTVGWFLCTSSLCT